MEVEIDPLLFGDNQFFGVNHMSESKAREQAIKFRDISSILRVLDVAFDEDITTFMCTTHGRVKDICDHHREHKSKYEGFKFYPCMPYAHKYANAVTEHGMVGAVRQFTLSEGLVNTMLRGGSSLARRDIDGIAKILVDMEMKMFDGLNTPVIFLQNVVVDLILGLGMHSAFKVFREHAREKYQAEAGFITMNFPLLLKALSDEGVRNPIVCTNFNKLGFRMSGGLEAYREAMDNYEVRTIAMSVFASGAIPPDEAIDWISKQDGVESIVFGASSQKNIHQTAELVHRHFGRRSVSQAASVEAS